MSLENPNDAVENKQPEEIAEKPASTQDEIFGAWPYETGQYGKHIEDALNANPELRNDRNFYIRLGTVMPKAFTQYAPEELKNDRNVWLEVLNGGNWKKSPNSTNVQSYGAEDILNRLPEQLKSDREIATAALVKAPSNFEYLSDELRANNDFMKDARVTNAFRTELARRGITSETRELLVRSGTMELTKEEGDKLVELINNEISSVDSLDSLSSIISKYTDARNSILCNYNQGANTSYMNSKNILQGINEAKNDPGKALSTGILASMPLDSPLRKKIITLMQESGLI